MNRLPAYAENTMDNACCLGKQAFIVASSLNPPIEFVTNYGCSLVNKYYFAIVPYGEKQNESTI